MGVCTHLTHTHTHPQGFSSEQCPEGFVAVVKNTLRILSVDNVGEAFNQSISRLRYTPRRLLIHPDFRTLIVAESDYQAVPIADNPELQKRLTVGWGGGQQAQGQVRAARATCTGLLPPAAAVTLHFVQHSQRSR